MKNNGKNLLEYRRKKQNESSSTDIIYENGSEKNSKDSPMNKDFGIHHVTAITSDPQRYKGKHRQDIFTR